MRIERIKDIVSDSIRLDKNISTDLWLVLARLCDLLQDMQQEIYGLQTQINNAKYEKTLNDYFSPVLDNSPVTSPVIGQCIHGLSMANCGQCSLLREKSNDSVHEHGPEVLCPECPNWVGAHKSDKQFACEIMNNWDHPASCEHRLVARQMLMWLSNPDNNKGLGWHLGYESSRSPEPGRFSTYIVDSKADVTDEYFFDDYIEALSWLVIQVYEMNK